MIFDAVEKAGLNAIVAGAACCPVFGSDAKVYIPFANSSAPLCLLAAAVGGVGSLLGDLAHLGIHEADISEKWKDNSSFVTGLAINAALFPALLYCFNPTVARDFGLITAAGVGAASEFVGSASYSYLKENLYL